MRTRHSKCWWVACGALIGGLLMLAACGGGGGGGGEPSPTIPSSYTGLTTKAVITEANAVAIVSGAWSGGQAGRDIGEVLPLQQIPDGGAAASVASLALTRAVGETAMQSIPIGEQIPRAVGSFSDALPGDCGGSVSFTVTLDDVSGDFTGQFTFSNYCSMEIVLNGFMGMTGKADPTFETISELELAFTKLNVAEGGNSVTITEGTVTYVLAADLSGETDTLNVVLRDETLAKTYWLKDYAITIGYGGDSVDTVTVTGRYYDPDFGFVDVTTDTPLDVGNTAIPTAGVLHFAGENSQAWLTFNEDGTTLLEVDSDNDGKVDAPITNPLAS